MKYIKCLCIIILPILIINSILIIFSYFNKYNLDLDITSYVVTMLSCLIGGFYIGKSTKNKAYLEGLKVGSIVALLFLILRILSNKLTLIRIIYYLLIIVVTTIGSILGINKKIKAK